MAPQAAFLLLIGLGSAPDAIPRDLPARFEADLVYLQPGDGTRRLRLYTDTGGGLFLKQDAVERLGLPSEPGDAGLVAELGEGASYTRLPDFVHASGIPDPAGTADGRLPVMPAAAAHNTPLPGTGEDDGMLGQAWFADRVWTWDYPGERLRLESPHWRPTADMRRVALGFPTGDDGRRSTSFPRIDVIVDGRTLPMLLDTGAMTVLTTAALRTLDDGMPAQRATSMITDHLFQAWREAHPDWRVIESAQTGTGAAMIEVPEVEIAGWRVGPVWFTHRPDANFHRFMSSMMDARVEGALGGNALRHFVMTVHYPEAAAWFDCITCRAQAPR